jgi:hypothetical protein
MENIVPIAQLPNHISKVLEAIRYGVAEQRNAGLIVDMPEEVTFQCQVVFDFQSMAVRRVSETVEDSDRSEVGTVSDSGETTRESQSTQAAATGHNQTETTIYTEGADA